MSEQRLRQHRVTVVEGVEQAVDGRISGAKEKAVRIPRIALLVGARTTAHQRGETAADEDSSNDRTGAFHRSSFRTPPPRPTGTSYEAPSVTEVERMAPPNRRPTPRSRTICGVSCCRTPTSAVKSGLSYRSTKRSTTKPAINNVEERAIAWSTPMPAMNRAPESLPVSETAPRADGASARMAAALPGTQANDRPAVGMRSHGTS